ncbi:hypothetical protein H0O03_04860 [Candidatus Micrarchaeota archaeon]|nr:hypothetical protein [Candidatus Micrarchaeota archaeon]
MALVFSTECAAGRNIAAQLIQNGFQPIGPVPCAGKHLPAWKNKDGLLLIQVSERLSRDVEYLSQLPLPEEELVVFLSRHRAENGPSSFTVHSLGNWGFDPERGGNPRELARASAGAVAAAFEYYRAHALEGFRLDLEATHHGPTSLPWPSLFVEVGSGEKEWQNQAACAVAAEAALAACSQKKKGKVALAFGGTHYCPKFGGLEGKDYLFSHIAPGYACDSLDENLFTQAVQKTVEKVECAVIDWKGLSSQQRKKVIALAEQAGRRWEKA